MKRVLIVGGSGDVGSYILPHFMGEYDLSVCDIAELGAEGNCRYVKGDVTKLSELCEASKNINSIIHLAAIRTYDTNNERLMKVNVDGTFNVLEAAKRNGVKNVVISSSVCAMGAIFKSKEFTPAYLPIDEEIPDLPDDMYGMSKLINEHLAYVYSSRYKIRIICLRLASVLLPSVESTAIRVQNMDRPDLEIRRVEGVPITQKSLFWQYLEPRDLPHAYQVALSALEMGKLTFGIYNIGASDTLSTIPTPDLIRRCYSNVEHIKDRRILEKNTHEPIFSISKARKDLGYDPKYTWRDFSLTQKG